VSPTDTTVLALSAGLLLTVAFVASYLPARRAAAIDPAITLRAD
jgi:putative ABC transport system permease protein